MIGNDAGRVVPRRSLPPIRSRGMHSPRPGRRSDRSAPTRVETGARHSTDPRRLDAHGIGRQATEVNFDVEDMTLVDRACYAKFAEAHVAPVRCHFLLPLLQQHARGAAISDRSQ